MVCLFIHFFVFTLLRDHKLKAFDNNLAKVFNALYRLFVIYLTQGSKEMISSTIVLIYSIQGCLKIIAQSISFVMLVYLKNLCDSIRLNLEVIFTELETTEDN